MNTKPGSPTFIDRPAAFKELQSHLDAVRETGRGQLLAVRGRRQAGKSTLVERFTQMADVPSLFMTAALGRSPAEHLQSLATAAHESLHPLPDVDVSFATPPESWQSVFTSIALAANDGPLIIVLDEFPWLTRADRSLEGVLQTTWDRVLEKLPVLMILIGSDVTMMQRLSTYDRPLFGRLLEMIVDTLDLGEVASAFPSWSAAETIDAYLTIGGYPRLVTDMAASGKSPAEYVRQSLNNPVSPLLMIGRLVLGAEFPEPVTAAEILAAIGSNDSGHPRFSEISVESDGSGAQSRATATSRALKLLSETKRLVEQETPAWAETRSRLRRYRITDPYLRFWFRYVDDYSAIIERGRADLAIDHFDRDWSSWRGHSVEPLVRQSLFRLGAKRPELKSIEQVLPWWTRDGQHEVDVVGVAHKATVLLGTIKWRNNGGVTARDMIELAAAAPLIPHSDKALLAAVCRQGDLPDGAHLLFTAQDIVNAWRQ